MTPAPAWTRLPPPHADQDHSESSLDLCRSPHSTILGAQRLQLRWSRPRASPSPPEKASSPGRGQAPLRRGPCCARRWRWQVRRAAPLHRAVHRRAVLATGVPVRRNFVHSGSLRRILDVNRTGILRSGHPEAHCPRRPFRRRPARQGTHAGDRSDRKRAQFQVGSPGALPPFPRRSLGPRRQHVHLQRAQAFSVLRNLGLPLELVLAVSHRRPLGGGRGFS